MAVPMRPGSGRQVSPRGCRCSGKRFGAAPGAGTRSRHGVLQCRTIWRNPGLQANL